jgi:catechol 2,3-dioxygenase-like lactoylglutathione lyase family enzyme
MIRQMAHICIKSTDLAETGRFYFDALGLEKKFSFIKNNEEFGYYIGLGQNTFVEVFKGEPLGDGNIVHVAIQVDDLDGLIERIRQHGYEVTDKKQGNDSSWQAWVTDPSGVKIEFHEYTPDSSQITGRDCVLD